MMRAFFCFLFVCLNNEVKVQCESSLISITLLLCCQ